mmetsp:Transcript_32288/g.55845  ORF Transcript_32288/g.55845 Transcript_32288/m.55845 type:complete len:170 (-) Transcript_32288:578-1087(-)|eukprot:CAMPEP_0204911750 /NCGR_PEP_ID=MMETSP1397-20131031/10026_1 /ASSEMBLY_ACC=CAM_ASM_000891 /TAXON_ID=49980 /ORGANISM="Climacostomum Climacostomum virens, Strain Stock W-24" /LENGTH=169 /DNA_ID=CAMNT_0052082413 /DNA_START=29 /DNA_END=538 /DNA_ORIENTATION=+
MKAEPVVVSPSGLCCHYSLYSKSQRRKHTKKRKRKSSDQLRQLKVEFDKHTDWTKELMTELALRTGLSEAQVYKWGWDQKKKVTVKTRDGFQYPPSLADLFAESAPTMSEIKVVPSGPVYSNMLCYEVLTPCALDIQLYSLQKSYRLSVESFTRERAQFSESRQLGRTM